MAAATGSGSPPGSRTSSRPGSSRNSSRPGSRARSAGGGISAAERAKQLEAAKLGIEYKPEVQVYTEYELGVQLSGQAIMPVLPRSPTLGENTAPPGGRPAKRNPLNPKPSTSQSRSTSALPLGKLYVRQNPKHAAPFGSPAPSGPAAEHVAAKVYRRGAIPKYVPDIDSPYIKSVPKPDDSSNMSGWGPSSRSVRSSGNVRPHSRAALIPTPRHAKKHSFVDVVTRRVWKPESKVDPRWQQTWEWDPLAPREEKK